jgi:hypothetical protein
VWILLALLFNAGIYYFSGPWRYALSEIDYTPEVTAAVITLQAALSPPAEISQRAA